MTGLAGGSLMQLFRPTLVRRVFVSLLLACTLTWVALMGLSLYLNMGDGKTTQELASVSDYVAEGLAGIDDDKAAAAFVAGAVGETSRDAYNWRNFREVQYELTNSAGQVIESSGGSRPSTMTVAAGAVTPVTLHERRFLLTRRDANGRTLYLALPLHSFFGILRDDWLGLLLQVLLVFPFFFAAAWLAITRGLRPLQQLSATIAARGSDDLTPVAVEPRFDELRPLVTALDSLLLALRNKVSREHAFVQDAAHELRTPLAVISAQAHVMGMAASPSERLAAERQMDQAIARAAHLVHQLLDLARLDNDSASQITTVDLVELVRQHLAPRVPAAHACGLELSLETPDSLLISTEPQVLLSVLHNLVDNALRYVPAGGRVLVEIQRTNTGVSLSVSDDGPGIPAEQMELAFERFHRVLQTNAAGAGLGLPITRKAAARLGGTITLSMGLDGKGCRFELLLPQRPN